MGVILAGCASPSPVAPADAASDRPVSQDGTQRVDAADVAAPCLDAGVRCADACVDLASDLAHCGACDNACASGYLCRAGRCEQDCGARRVHCAGECVDLEWDYLNCGACGNRCGAASLCRAGRCEPRCAAGLTPCGFACLDLATSVYACGGCGNTCPRDGICEAGRCVCGRTSAVCDGACVDLSRDENCGACGNRCPADRRCEGGACIARCAAPQSWCRDACVELARDRSNCGACGNTCGAERVCVDGACRCVAPGVECVSGCVDVRSDPANCGACGVRCGPEASCVDGRCAPCPAGRARCAQSTCAVDIERDAANCGACDVACPSPSPFTAPTCVDAHCATRCTDGHADCTGDPGCETDTLRDDAHCGACGRRCAGDERCRAGACVPRLPRPRRPMSGAEVLTRRPRFAWLLGDGYDGARIEVCATRACDAVLRSADVTGDRHNFAEPFAPGVYFWRVRGRRGMTLDARPTAVWPIAVSSTQGPLTPERVLADYDGDGREDPLPVIARLDHLGAPCSDPSYGTEGLRSISISVLAVGDVDGDGFGDALVREPGYYNNCYSQPNPGIARTIAFGGPAGLQRSSLVSVDQAHVHSAPGWSDVPAEDVDGDGLADRVSCRTYDGGQIYWCDVIRGADPTRAIALGGPVMSYGGHPVSAGDLDGDLGAELTWRVPDGLGGRLDVVWRVAAGGASLVEPPRCDAIGAEPIQGNATARALLVAPDDDRDGVVDIVANATRAGITMRVRWFGGPGAPRADRCALEAP